MTHTIIYEADISGGNKALFLLLSFDWGRKEYVYGIRADLYHRGSCETMYFNESAGKRLYDRLQYGQIIMNILKKVGQTPDESESMQLAIPAILPAWETCIWQRPQGQSSTDSSFLASSPIPRRRRPILKRQNGRPTGSSDSESELHVNFDTSSDRHPLPEIVAGRPDSESERSLNLQSSSDRLSPPRTPDIDFENDRNKLYDENGRAYDVVDRISC